MYNMVIIIVYQAKVGLTYIYIYSFAGSIESITLHHLLKSSKKTVFKINICNKETNCIKICITLMRLPGIITLAAGPQ